VARDESKKFEVAPQIDECRYRVRRPGRVREIRKETSECDVRAWLGVRLQIDQHVSFPLLPVDDWKNLWYHESSSTEIAVTG